MHTEYSDRMRMKRNTGSAAFGITILAVAGSSSKVALSVNDARAKPFIWPWIHHTKRWLDAAWGLPIGFSTRSGWQHWAGPRLRYDALLFVESS